MNKLFLTALLFLFSFQVYAQTTTYYKDRYLKKETTAEKAGYSLTTTKLPDGRTITELRNMKESKTIYKSDNNGEPYGIWQIETGSGFEELNYDFELNDKDTACTATPLDASISNIFENNDSIGYSAPVFASGEKTFYTYLAKQVHYPAYARENGITGRVVLSCIFSTNGSIEKIAIIKGDHVSLNKEAVRVIRKIKFSSPAKLKGVAHNFCVVIPISFKLD